MDVLPEPAQFLRHLVAIAQGAERLAILLVLGLLSFGFLAMVAYLIAGPDSTATAPSTFTGAPAPQS